MCNLLIVLFNSLASSSSSGANLISQKSAGFKLFSVVNWGQEMLRVSLFIVCLSMTTLQRWSWINSDIKAQTPSKIYMCTHLLRMNLHRWLSPFHSSNFSYCHRPSHAVQQVPLRKTIWNLLSVSPSFGVFKLKYILFFSSIYCCFVFDDLVWDNCCFFFFVFI